MEIQKKIKDHLTRGETDIAIEQLLSYSQTKSKEFQNNCILLSSQFQEWKENKIRGINQGSEDLRRIESSILELLEIGENPKEKVLVPVMGKIKNKWIIAIPLVLTSILVVSLLVNFGNDHSDYIFIEPRNGEILTRQLIDSCYYWVSVKGKVIGNRNQKIFGKYYHSGKWYSEEIENPINLEADGSWEVSFPHGEKGNPARKMEEFKFGIFQIEKGKSIDSYKKLVDISFNVRAIN